MVLQKRIVPLLVVTVLLALLLPSGCSNAVIHPGTANQFDSDTYSALQVTNSLIVSTKASYAAGSFPASIMPQVKSALNNLIQAYDIADNVYLAYHNAANSTAGATPAQQAAVTTAMSQVNTASSSLITVTTGSK
jgi:hypothetical protein